MPIKRQSKSQPNWQLIADLKGQGYQRIVGLDEVGRGSLAGPLVVGAVELANLVDFAIQDSKLLTLEQRIAAVRPILTKARQVSFGAVSAAEIDQLGLRVALKLAYERALEGLEADLLLCDRYRPTTKISVIQSIKGDSLFYPTAAASILAKNLRDNLMRCYHLAHPHYDWVSNVGYGTKKHLDGISQFGLTNLHRKSFVKK